MSFPSVVELADYPGLIPWLAQGTWRADFERSALNQTSELAVATICLKEDGPDFDDMEEDCELLIEAQVNGASPRPFRTRLFIFYEYDSRTSAKEIDLVTECSCFNASGCKHAVAVLATLQAIARSMPAPSAPQINAALAVWLRKIKESAAAKPSEKKPPQPYNKFLAYCIEAHPGYHASDEGTLNFVLRVGNHNKTGFSIESNIASADPSRPTKYMATEDMPICARYHQRKRKHHLWGGTVPLEGDDWDEILTPALATGRLFFGENGVSRHASAQYTRITEGPALTIEASWELLANGDARPILKLPSPTIRAIPTEPFRYLDRETHLLGILQSHLPTAMLRTWAAGPTIPADSIPNLSRALAAISPDNPLPLPAENPARILTGLAPSPCLHITEVLVGVFLQRHIGGVLKFRYPGSPSLLPLGKDAPHMSAWIENETRVTLERDAAAESAFSHDLSRGGLTALHEIFPARDLNDKNRHSVALKSPKATAADWLDWLDSPARHDLDAKGWIIETDPKLGLTIHDIHDFFPAIEADPDHGIDWFRFDVTGEFDGKRISFIPQIARAIAEDWHLRYQDPAQLPDTLLLPCDQPADGHIRFPAPRFLEMLEQVRHLFHGMPQGAGPLRLDRLGAAP